MRYVEAEDRTPSESAPGGSWVSSVRYPQIERGVASEIQSAVNEAIVAHVGKYTCAGPGDQQFMAAVTRSDGTVLSVNCEAMWMCTSMPAPQSKTGGLTFDLRPGHKVHLDEELTDAARREALERRVGEGAKVAVSRKLGSNATYCPEPGRTSEFFLTDSAAVFVGMFPSHVDAACEVEVSIPLGELRPFLRGGSVLASRAPSSSDGACSGGSDWSRGGRRPGAAWRVPSPRSRQTAFRRARRRWLSFGVPRHNGGIALHASACIFSAVTQRVRPLVRISRTVVMTPPRVRPS